MHEPTAETPISLNIDIVWSESLLSAWTNVQADLSLSGLQAILFVWIFKNLLRFMSQDRRDVTALATHVNKCTEVKWAVNSVQTWSGSKLFETLEVMSSWSWTDEFYFCIKALHDIVICW